MHPTLKRTPPNTEYIMVTRTIPLLAALLMLSAATILPATVQAQSNEQRATEIRTLLDQRDQEIKALLQGKQKLSEADRAQLKTMINGIIDFHAMARTALGPHWAALSAEEQRDFVDVFSEIVRSQSLSNLDVYRTNVTYNQIDVDGSAAHVSTSVTFKDVPTRVDYVLAYRDGEWRVDDIILDEVSTAQGYARSFQPVVNRRGFDVLMSSLRKKLESVASGS